MLQAKAAAGQSLGPDELFDTAIRQNVERVVRRLKTASAIPNEPLQAGRLKIVGARYDLDDGNVAFFES